MASGNKTMQDMNTVFAGSIPAGWSLTAATAVDNNGDIVRYGNNGSPGAGFLLSPAIPGDANLDGRVDINDLTIVLSHYGQTGMAWAQGEFVGDGSVDINDLTIVLAHYNLSFGRLRPPTFPPCRSPCLGADRHRAPRRRWPAPGASGSSAENIVLFHRESTSFRKQKGESFNGPSLSATCMRFSFDIGNRRAALAAPYYFTALSPTGSYTAVSPYTFGTVNGQFEVVGKSGGGFATYARQCYRLVSSGHRQRRRRRRHFAVSNPRGRGKRRGPGH